MKFKRETVIILYFEDLPTEFTESLEPPNDGYFSINFHRFLEEGESLKDLWSYEDVSRWKQEFYSTLLEDHPNNLRWQRTLAKNPEVYLKEDSPLQAYLMTQLTPDDVDGVRKILVYCNF